MQFITDNSTQSITSLSLITGSYNAVATKADVNLKQDILTVSTNLLGIGSSITQLDYNKITINKPTNFQADWNSTIINKPTYFQTDWNTTITNRPDLTLKENVLTFSSPLIRNTNTISIDLSTYDTITARNNALVPYLTSNASSNIFLTIANASSTYATQTNLNLKENILTFSSPLIRTTNAISIDLSLYDTISARNTALGAYLTTSTASSTYLTITNASSTYQPKLTFSLPLTNTANTVSIDLTNYLTTASASSTYLTQTNASSTYQPKLTASTALLGNGSAITNLSYGNITGTPTLNYLPLIGGNLTGNLTVGNTDTWQTSLTINNTNGNAYQFNIGGSGNTAIGTNAMGIYDGNITVNNYVMVWKGGSVGIGITSPNSGLKLEVAGQLRVSGGANIGTCQISYGGASQAGYVAFNNPSGNRVGYVGWICIVNAENYLLLETESTQSYVGYCLNGKLVVGTDNNYPQIQMGTTNGHNLGIATGAGSFSTSASAGDMILRSINKLHLQSGTGGASITINTTNNVGIGNTNPINDGSINHLCIGNSGVGNSEGGLVIGKNNNAGGSRHCKFSINPSFYWAIGDYGNNNTAGTYTRQLLISYQAGSAQLIMENDTKNYGQFVNTSDERIKTNIRNIDNALDKVLLLQGVNYTLIQENTEEIGLIAQDVELVVPEAVKECSLTNLKGINYQGLVGLLVEAIKDQQKQINELKTILKNNNIY